MPPDFARVLVVRFVVPVLVAREPLLVAAVERLFDPVERVPLDLEAAERVLLLFARVALAELERDFAAPDLAPDPLVRPPVLRALPLRAPPPLLLALLVDPPSSDHLPDMTR